MHCQRSVANVPKNFYVKVIIPKVKDTAQLEFSQHGNNFLLNQNNSNSKRLLLIYYYRRNIANVLNNL